MGNKPILTADTKLEIVPFVNGEVGFSFPANPI
jgi:hypothetical protein